MSTQMDKLLAAQEKAVQKKQQAEMNEKRIKKKIVALTRSERTHRLCTRSAMLETFLQEPETLTDDEVMDLLQRAFGTLDVQNHLSTILRRRKREMEQAAREKKRKKAKENKGYDTILML